MLVTIEGIDGSGKGTQARMLQERLESVGYKVACLDFPRYSETFFGSEIASYLNGDLGALMEVHPKLTALLYAGDRYETREQVMTLCAQNNFVICDRYTPSNQAHQAVKFPRSKWPAFFEWVQTLEYDVFKIPQPHLVIFLDLGAEYAAQLIRKKPKRSYTELEADIHEVDNEYQAAVYEAYKALSVHSDWLKVTCVSDGALLSTEEIHSSVWEGLKNRGLV